MSVRPIPQRIYEQGFRPLVSVIPPGASLAPTSSVKPSQLGKTPGLRGKNGTWFGYGWLKHVPTIDDVKQWGQAGANIGILGAYYPALDIDTMDEWLSCEIAAMAQTLLGPAPSRVGKAPKQLLMYRTGVPFPRMALVIHKDGEKHLVEMLGAGRQYLIYGMHPSGSRYTWDRCPWESTPADLTEVTAEQVSAFLDDLKAMLEMIPGITVDRVGDGTLRDAEHTPEPDDLRAPSLDALRACVTALPNTDDMFPERDDYIKVGYAIRAAGGDDDDVFDLWADWCDRWEGGTNDPETIHADWRRMQPPYSIGWSWLAEMAKRYGFEDAAFEFEADPLMAVEVARTEATTWSDQWLVDRVIEEFGSQLRFVPLTQKWYVWDGTRWAPDAMLAADALIARTLRRLAIALERQGVTPKEIQANAARAKTLCSARMQREVRHLLRMDARITASPEQFDADPWLLNTPGGIVDLRSGSITEADPDQLCALITRVAPDFEMPMPRWTKFLQETTNYDVEMMAYLQRLIGYALTGSTSEQMFAFLWGDGGNGKGTFLRAIESMMHHYAKTAAMDTFVASTHDRHPTDLAGLVGARLVTAVETQRGRHWDEQRVKSLTGSDLIKARFMRQDFFTYKPQFTLIFAGNHKPEIRDMDDAMRRRVNLVPFLNQPPVRDNDLDDKLRPEFPAILAWAIKGCLAWQEHGLMPPTVVLDATQEYFEEEDAVGRWLEECCTEEPDTVTATGTLFASWEQWANATGEHVGSVRRLAQALLVKKYPKDRDPTRQRGFRGLAITPNLNTLGG